MKSIEGGRVQLKLEGGSIEILIRNRSLFSVHVSPVGFEIAGETIQLSDPGVPTRFRNGEHERRKGPPMQQCDSDPWEVASQACAYVSVARDRDPTAVLAALQSAAAKYQVAPDDLYAYSSTRALTWVVTEAGKIFTSAPAHKRLVRWFQESRKKWSGTIRIECDMGTQNSGSALLFSAK